MNPRLPLLLLDVDGVIAILGPGDHEPTREAQVTEWPITLSLEVPGRLQRLSERFGVIWATSWGQAAADELAAMVGLPDGLPHLKFDPASFRGFGSYKLPVVKRFVGDRPVAWMDDELAEDVTEWARHREATLVIRPDPRYGLTDDHVDELLRFASGVRQWRA